MDATLGRWLAVVVNPLLMALAVAVVPVMNSIFSLNLSDAAVTTYATGLVATVAGAAVLWLRNKIPGEIADLHPSPVSLGIAGRVMGLLTPAVTAVAVGFAAWVKQKTGADIDSTQLSILLGSVAAGSLAVFAQWSLNRGKWVRAAYNVLVPTKL
jgi:hypothetical protein